jgi:hypothetical protein
MNGAFTIFEYLYRDSSNYKVWGKLRLTGTTSPDDETALRDCLESEELFIAEQVEIPVLYRELWSLSGGPTSDDHAYHEFVALRPPTEDEDLSLPIIGSFSNFLDAFQKIQHRWRCSLSHNV